MQGGSSVDRTRCRAKAGFRPDPPWQEGCAQAPMPLPTHCRRALSLRLRTAHDNMLRAHPPLPQMHLYGRRYCKNGPVTTANKAPFSLDCRLVHGPKAAPAGWSGRARRVSRQSVVSDEAAGRPAISSRTGSRSLRHQRSITQRAFSPLPCNIPTTASGCHKPSAPRTAHLTSLRLVGRGRGVGQKWKMQSLRDSKHPRSSHCFKKIKPF